MPAIKSSSKGGTKLTLFANERKALEKSHETCKWIVEHADAETELCAAAVDAREGIAELLAALAEPSKSTGNVEKTKS
jgi:hypothetical protein